MNQTEYEQIIECIKFGAPANANKLIAAFNNVMKLVIKQEEPKETVNKEATSEDK